MQYRGVYKRIFCLIMLSLFFLPVVIAQSDTKYSNYRTYEEPVVFAQTNKEEVVGLLVLSSDERTMTLDTGVYETIQTLSANLTPFGGIYFIDDESEDRKRWELCAPVVSDLDLDGSLEIVYSVSQSALRVGHFNSTTGRIEMSTTATIDGAILGGCPISITNSSERFLLVPVNNPSGIYLYTYDETTMTLVLNVTQSSASFCSNNGQVSCIPMDDGRVECMGYHSIKVACTDNIAAQTRRPWRYNSLNSTIETAPTCCSSEGRATTFHQVIAREVNTTTAEFIMGYWDTPVGDLSDYKLSIYHAHPTGEIERKAQITVASGITRVADAIGSLRYFDPLIGNFDVVYSEGLASTVRYKHYDSGGSLIANVEINAATYDFTDIFFGAEICEEINIQPSVSVITSEISTQDVSFWCIDPFSNAAAKEIRMDDVTRTGSLLPSLNRYGQFGRNLKTDETTGIVYIPTSFGVFRLDPSLVNTQVSPFTFTSPDVDQLILNDSINFSEQSSYFFLDVTGDGILDMMTYSRQRGAMTWSLSSGLGSQPNVSRFEVVADPFCSGLVYPTRVYVTDAELHDVTVSVDCGNGLSNDTTILLSEAQPIRSGTVYCGYVLPTSSNSSQFTQTWSIDDPFSDSRVFDTRVVTVVNPDVSACTTNMVFQEALTDEQTEEQGIASLNTTSFDKELKSGIDALAGGGTGSELYVLLIVLVIGFAVTVTLVQVGAGGMGAFVTGFVVVSVLLVMFAKMQLVSPIYAVLVFFLTAAFTAIAVFMGSR